LRAQRNILKGGFAQRGKKRLSTGVREKRKNRAGSGYYRKKAPGADRTGGVTSIRIGYKKGAPSEMPRKDGKRGTRLRIGEGTIASLMASRSGRARLLPTKTIKNEFNGSKQTYGRTDRCWGSFKGRGLEKKSW